MIKLILNIFAGVVLALGWGVDVHDIGVVRFAFVWLLGCVILRELDPFIAASIDSDSEDKT